MLRPSPPSWCDDVQIARPCYFSRDYPNSIKLVPLAGLEPARCCHHLILTRIHPLGTGSGRGRETAHGRNPLALASPVQGSDLECRVPRSINAFRAYGGIGLFHGGATLQELITPVVIFRWPKKAEKVAAVLTPVLEITSLKPRVEVKVGVGQTAMFGADAKMIGRRHREGGRPGKRVPPF